MHASANQLISNMPIPYPFQIVLHGKRSGRDISIYVEKLKKTLRIKSYHLTNTNEELITRDEYWNLEFNFFLKALRTSLTDESVYFV